MIRKIVLLAIAVGLCTPLTVQATSSEDAVKEAIVKNSVEMGIDPALALSIAKKESGFKHELRSAKGAVGVFQMMPSTAHRMGYDPYQLNENIKAGLTYYKRMYDLFGSTELALAAYNAGPGNVRKYGCIPPYSETRRFVSVIMSDYNRLKASPDPVIAKCSTGIKLAKTVPTQKHVATIAKVHTHNTATTIATATVKKSPVIAAQKFEPIVTLDTHNLKPAVFTRKHNQTKNSNNKEVPASKNANPVMEVL